MEIRFHSISSPFSFTHSKPPNETKNSNDVRPFPFVFNLIHLNIKKVRYIDLKLVIEIQCSRDIFTLECYTKFIHIDFLRRVKEGEEGLSRFHIHHRHHYRSRTTLWERKENLEWSSLLQIHFGIIHMRRQIWTIELFLGNRCVHR